jgi:5-formyltetrahydrofolate cyclo-ligase
VGESKRVTHGGKISGMNDISLAKATIRKHILTLRKESNLSNEALTSNLLKVVGAHDPKRVATYLSFPSEPNTADFIKNLVKQGIQVLVPETLATGELAWHDFLDGSKSELIAGDLLFVPALAVDRSGNRLGRGKGYFDKELASLDGVVIYAVVFEHEVLEQVPTEAHDKRVHGVVTQEQILKIN